ncbi:hypothetical protein HZA97_01730 [Candidatus Woesearchaeota archaeon]|nr:hypothetical protein [Candidatus Woesearchaeota archaeon]
MSEKKEISDKLTPEDQQKAAELKRQIDAQLKKTGRTVVNVTDLFGDAEDRAVAMDAEERKQRRNCGRDYDGGYDRYCS